MSKIQVSIVIVSFNTKDYLEQCIRSIYEVTDKVKFEIIVSDNGSEDGSVELVRKKFPKVILIDNQNNLGFAKGNNQARNFCKGEFILFLNSDTKIYSQVLTKTISFLQTNKEFGAVTCKVNLANGLIDPDTRRSFPTPWVSFTHFSKLDRLFPKSLLFSKYWYGYLPESTSHEIEVLQGAFCLIRKKLLDEIDWFDESYFLDGEDIDLCWKIKLKAKKIYYLADCEITHYKGASKGKGLRHLTFEEKAKRIKVVKSGVNAMEIFYRKRLWNKYSILINIMVVLAIRIMKMFRVLGVLLS